MKIFVDCRGSTSQVGRVVLWKESKSKIPLVPNNNYVDLTQFMVVLTS